MWNENLQDQKVIKLFTCSKLASDAFAEKQYNVAIPYYRQALDTIIELVIKNKTPTKNIIKYMLSMSLIKTNELKNLIEAAYMLNSLEILMGNNFPAIYAALGEVHCKLYRYDEGFKAVEKGFAFLANKYKQIAKYDIPGSNLKIKEATKEGLEDTLRWLKEECSKWHQPDAICCLTECQNITQPYITVNKHMWFSDPAFNGLIVTSCNNHVTPCTMKYHRYCWKVKKDNQYPRKRISDKDMLGSKCSNENCANRSFPCVINKIEIIGPNGKRIALVEETLPKKINDTDVHAKVPATDAVNGAASSNEDFYNNFIYMKEDGPEPEFSKDEKSKTLVYSLLANYIQFNSPVRIADVLQKWEDIKHVLHKHFGPERALEVNQIIKNNYTDVCDFLLSTSKFSILDEKTEDIGSSFDVNDENGREKELDLTDDVRSTEECLDIYNQLVEGNEHFDEVNSTNNEEFQLPNIAQPDPRMYALKGAYSDLEYRKYSDDDDDGSDGNSYSSPALNTSDSIKIGNEFDYNAIAVDYSKTAGMEVDKHKKRNPAMISFCESFSEKVSLDQNGSNEDATNFSESNDMRAQLQRKLRLLKRELERKNMEINDISEENAAFRKKMELFESLSITTKNLEHRHEVLQSQYLHMKSVLVDALEEKSQLAEILSNQNQSDYVEMAKEKFDRDLAEMTKELKEKNKALEDTLHSEYGKRTALLEKCLNEQYFSNKHLLAGFVKQCNETLDIIEKMNDWLFKTVGYKPLLDTSIDWMKRLNYLKSIESELQEEYIKLLSVLKNRSNDHNIVEEINIELVDIPSAPALGLGDIVQGVLNSYFIHMQQMVQRALPQPLPPPLLTYMPRPMVQQMHMPNHHLRFPAQMPREIQTVQGPSPGGPKSSAIPKSPAIPITPPAVQITPTKIVMQANPAVANLNVPVLYQKPVQREQKDDGPEESEPCSIKDSTLIERSIENVEKLTSDEVVIVEAEENVVKDVLHKEDIAVIFAADVSINKEEAKSEEIAYVEFETCNAEVANDKHVSHCENLTRTVEDINVADCDNQEKEAPVQMSSIDSAGQDSESACAVTSPSRNLDKLMDALRNENPGILDLHIYESLAAVRRENNNSLSGLKVLHVLDRAREHLRNKVYLDKPLKAESQKKGGEPNNKNPLPKSTDKPLQAESQNIGGGPNIKNPLPKSTDKPRKAESQKQGGGPNNKNPLPKSTDKPLQAESKKKGGAPDNKNPLPKSTGSRLILAAKGELLKAEHQTKVVGKPSKKKSKPTALHMDSSSVLDVLVKLLYEEGQRKVRGLSKPNPLSKSTDKPQKAESQKKGGGPNNKNPLPKSTDKPLTVESQNNGGGSNNQIPLPKSADKPLKAESHKKGGKLNNKNPLPKSTDKPLKDESQNTGGGSNNKNPLPKSTDTPLKTESQKKGGGSNNKNPLPKSTDAGGESLKAEHQTKVAGKQSKKKSKLAALHMDSSSVFDAVLKLLNEEGQSKVVGPSKPNPLSKSTDKPLKAESQKKGGGPNNQIPLPKSTDTPLKTESQKKGGGPNNKNPLPKSTGAGGESLRAEHQTKELGKPSKKKSKPTASNMGIRLLEAIEQPLKAERHSTVMGAPSTKCQLPTSTGKNEKGKKPPALMSLVFLNLQDTVSVEQKPKKSPATPVRGWNALPALFQWVPDVNESQECTICMSDIDVKQYYLLSCNHVFHKKCISAWMQRERTCPNCRVPATLHEEFPPLKK